jgi:hypothetical protein
MRTLLCVCTALAIMAIFAAHASAEPIVYPAKGQSDAKMSKDKSACTQWAEKETGINPAAPPTSTTHNSPQAVGGRRLRGGARGAAGGAAIGAIAGDAGKGAAIGAVAGGMRGGMEQRKERKAEEQQAQTQAATQQQQTMSTFNRAYAACLEGRGYTVK